MGLKKFKSGFYIKKNRWIEVHQQFVKQKLSKQFNNRFLNLHQIFPNLNCNVCDNVGFNLATGVYRHVEKVHGPHNAVVCEICLEVFTIMKALKKHLRTHKEKQVCEDCGNTFHYKSKHMKKFHTKEKTEKGNSSREMIMRGFEEDCRCNLDFMDKNDQYKRNHFKRIHRGYTPCPKCKQLLKDIKRYKHSCHDKAKLKAQNRCKEYRCQECGVVKTKKVGLKDHMQSVHRPETMVQCKFCPKLFTDSQLKGHMKKGPHTTKKACKICGKSIARMKFHIETSHKSDIDKRFKCDQCSKGFFGKTQLNAHIMNVHLKLRPFKCRHGCDQAYNDRSNLVQHEKRAHGVLGIRKEEQIQAELFVKLKGIN